MNAADCRDTYSPLPLALPGLCACLFFAWPQLGVAQGVYEPDLPTPTLADATGYFPTLIETPLLRGASDSRSLGQPLGPDLEEGPDLRAQTANDLFPYHDPEPNFYQRNDRLFRPIDRFLGVFTPHNAAVWESERLQTTSVTLDARLGILTREFVPELAMVKAGPLFFDLLWVGAGVLYTDFDGPSNFPRDGEDGWTAYIDLAMRAYLRLTDTIYLSAAADLMYLPFENEVALRFGNGTTDSLYTRLNYSDTIGQWDVLVFDEFRGSPGLNFFGEANVNAIDRAGRYFYGFQQTRANEFFNEDFTFFTNRLGLNASRLVFNNDWRFTIALDHTDFWRSFSFENHQNRGHGGLMLGYEGSVIPFAPVFMYDVYFLDDYDIQLHRFMASFTGRLTENINWIGQAGYLTSSGGGEYDKFLWSIGLEHTITAKTLHWLRFGEDFFANDLLPETLTTRFVQYGIDHRVNRALSLRAFVQLSENETIIPGNRMRDRIGAGLSIGFRPLDFTHIRALVMYEQMDQNRTFDEGERWLYRLEVTQQLGVRLTGQAFYQYEDNTIARSFSEHVMGMSLRRYF